MKSNTTIIVIVTLLVAGLAYWYFFTGTGNEPPLSVTGATTNQAQMQFETLVGELQPVSFNTKIFADARFNALVDISTSISPESIGRIDPLAPLSAASSAPAPAPPPAPAPSPVAIPVPDGGSTGTSSPEQ